MRKVGRRLPVKTLHRDGVSAKRQGGRDGKSEKAYKVLRHADAAAREEERARAVLGGDGAVRLRRERHDEQRLSRESQLASPRPGQGELAKQERHTHLNVLYARRL